MKYNYVKLTWPSHSHRCELLLLTKREHNPNLEILKNLASHVIALAIILKTYLSCQRRKKSIHSFRFFTTLTNFDTFKQS